MTHKNSAATESQVELVPVTRDNYVEVFDLEVAEGQKQFVADAAFSLVQAAYEPHWEPRAIVAAGQIVGFIMGGLIEPGVYEVSRILVDKRTQHRGYGSAALTQFLAEVQSRPEVKVIKTSYIPFNARAPGFYRRFGFRETSERWDEEIVMALPVRD